MNTQVFYDYATNTSSLLLNNRQICVGFDPTRERNIGYQSADPPEIHAYKLVKYVKIQIQ